MKRMEDKSVDLIVTDPPYGLNYNDGDLAHNREKVFGGKISQMVARPIANDGEKEADELFRAMLKESARILKPGSCCCCCCCGGGGPKPLFAKWTLWMDEFLDFKQAVVWDKGGLGMGMHYRRNYEFMLIAFRPGRALTWNGGNSTPNVWRIPKIIPRADQHPTEKPVELMAKVIHIHSNPDDIVYDPFVGHGSTLVAAQHSNRQWLGSEINPDYCKIAQRRVNEERAQTKMVFQ
jgi:DNA modification methylase